MVEEHLRLGWEKHPGMHCPEPKLSMLSLHMETPETNSGSSLVVPSAYKKLELVS